MSNSSLRVSCASRRVSGAGTTPGTLYVVATPIGNTGDITDRARRVLADADLIAAEDTRATRILLGALGIRNRTVSNHKFNERRQVDRLIERLENGEDIALVSDAGTPCVSDPGGILVAAAAARGIAVAAVCGASSATAALSVCGFPFDAFTFYGFLPRAAKDIRATLAGAVASAAPGTVPGERRMVAVFFESPLRIKKSLAVLADATPVADICLCNDLTKTYERIYRGSPAAVLSELEQNPSAGKGEYVLVADFARSVDGTSPTDADRISADGASADKRRAAGDPASTPATPAATPLSPEALLVDRLVKNGGTLKDAVAALAGGARANRQYTKKALYEAAVNLKSLFGD